MKSRTRILVQFPSRRGGYIPPDPPVLIKLGQVRRCLQHMASPPMRPRAAGVCLTAQPS